ncbi:Multidrug resistance protein abc superfamily, partial [Globisporangium polare]
MAFSRPERKFFVIGMIAACVSGLSRPSSALLISELVATMTLKYSEFKSDGLRSHLHSLSNSVTIYGICYLGGAVVVFLFAMIQDFSFKYMGEKLTARLRDVHFTALCRQNIAFFDEKKNATGALAADLSTNATKVALISGESQGQVAEAAFTFAAALVISFATGSWLLTLIMLAVFPLLLLGQIVRVKQFRGSGGLSDELAEVGAHASEALSNIRTVASLGMETSISDKFSALLEAPLKQGRREAQINGLAL